MKNNIILIIFILCGTTTFANYLDHDAIYSSNSEKVHKIVTSQEDLKQLSLEFEKDWSKYNNAKNLFKAYLLASNKSIYKYRKAAITLINYKLGDSNTSEMSIQDKIALNEFKKKIMHLLEYNENADLYALLCGLSFVLETKDKAMIYAQKSYKIKPIIYSPLYGYLKDLNGEYEEAIKLYNKAISNNKNDYDSMLSKAMSYINIGKEEEALKICKYLILKKVNLNDSISLAFHCLGKIEADDEDIIKIIAPNDINYPIDQTYTKLAKEMITNSSHLRHGRLMTERAIEINPENVNIYLTIANAYIEIGELDTAKSLLKQGLESVSTNSDKTKLILLMKQIK